MSANSSPPSDRGSSSLTPLSQSRNRRKSVAGENAQAIKVLCRFRPVKQVEIDRYGQSPSEGAGNFAVDEDRGTVESNVDFDRRSFTFDRVLLLLCFHRALESCAMLTFVLWCRYLERGRLSEWYLSQFRMPLSLCLKGLTAPF